MAKKDFEQLKNEAIESFPYLASDERSSNLKDASPIVLNTKNIDHPKTPPWVHFVAGGIGGMAGAIITCPFDVVKTRLQSDVFKYTHNHGVSSKNPLNIFYSSFFHFKETFDIINSFYRQEGPRSLFKGLGPILVGVIPARSINFFTYGITKDACSGLFNNGEEDIWVHLFAGATAGWATSTATNPIWMIKTRLQLDKTSDKAMRKYKGSWNCLRSIIRNEGILGLYKGLSASYLGSVESVIQWVLYEQMRNIIRQKSIEEYGNIAEEDKTTFIKFKEWCQLSGSAGAAKLFSSIITYPHEVLRTRLRQTPVEGGKLKYTGLFQSFKIILKEEGLSSMYSGLTPHLMRTVPNSIIMFGTWEIVIRLLS